MNRRKANAYLFARFFLLATCSGLLLTAGNFRPGATQPGRERKLNVRTFNRMPLKVKQVKNLQKEDDGWFRDLEIEVENVSDKPVYYIDVVIEFPDIPAPPPQPRADGSIPSRSTTGFWLSFGPPRLGDVKNLATPDDVALKPGETYVFKIPEHWFKGFEAMKRTYHFPPEAANKMELEFSIISFGDGTGYVAGEPRVYPKKKEQ